MGLCQHLLSEPLEQALRADDGAAAEVSQKMGVSTNPRLLSNGEGAADRAELFSDGAFPFCNQVHLVRYFILGDEDYTSDEWRTATLADAPVSRGSFTLVALPASSRSAIGSTSSDENGSQRCKNSAVTASMRAFEGPPGSRRVRREEKLPVMWEGSFSSNCISRLVNEEQCSGADRASLTAHQQGSA